MVISVEKEELLVNVDTEVAILVMKRETDRETVWLSIRVTVLSMFSWLVDFSRKRGLL